MPMKKNRFRFVCNNYTDDHKRTVQALNSRCLVYGHEIGPRCGTPHLQGYIEFSHSTNPGVKELRKLLPGFDVRTCDADADANIRYATKDLTDVFRSGAPGNDQVANGRKGREMEIERWDAIRANAVSGNFDAIESKVFVCQYNQIQAIHRNAVPMLEPLSELLNGWFTGVSGSGKSSTARSHSNGDFYNKDISKWWDGYTGQAVVIIDDVMPENAKELGRSLKIWADHYPFCAEFKGSQRYIRPKAIIVTSQYVLNEVFSDRDTRVALHRRFETVHFPIVAA